MADELTRKSRRIAHFDDWSGTLPAHYKEIGVAYAAFTHNSAVTIPYGSPAVKVFASKKTGKIIIRGGVTNNASHIVLELNEPTRPRTSKRLSGKLRQG